MLIQTCIPTWSQLLPSSWQCQCQLPPPKRSFSTMCRVKTCLRSMMKAERLAALALMHAYRDIPTDVEAVIREFCTKKNRCLAFRFLWVPLKLCLQLMCCSSGHYAVVVVHHNHNWLHFVKHSIISCSIRIPGIWQLIGVSRLDQITSQSTWIFRIFREGKSPDPSSTSRYCISPQYAPPRLTNKKCPEMPLTFDDLCCKQTLKVITSILCHLLYLYKLRVAISISTLTYIFSFPFMVWKSNSLRFKMSKQNFGSDFNCLECAKTEKLLVATRSFWQQARGNLLYSWKKAFSWWI